MIYGTTDGSADCECHRCIEDNKRTADWGKGCLVPLNFSKMIFCGECGNKRCPKASDHRLACTNSNEGGQEGSIYPKFDAEKTRRTA